MSYIYPIIRFNRMATLTLLYPERPLTAIAIAETISVFGTLINPYTYKKIYGLMIALMYAPKYADIIIDQHNKNVNTYRQAELCLILFINSFFIFYSLSHQP